MSIKQSLIYNGEALPWSDFDFTTDIISVRLMQNERVLASISNPHPTQCDLSFDKSESLNDTYYLVLETRERLFKVDLYHTNYYGSFSQKQ